MYHFFTDAANIDRESHKVRIEGSDYNHIRNVLRMDIGEELSVGTGEDDNEYRVAIAEFTEDAVLCDLLFVKESGVESPVRTILFQGLPKGDKMETVIQKCVELGVYEIVPVSLSRCVVKLDDKKAKAKVARWQGISEAAAKQSKRAVIPEIKMPMSMKEALEYAKDMDAKAIPYELCEGMDETAAFFRRLKKEVLSTKTDNPTPYRVAIFIGPEGGFTEEEIKAAREAGVEPVSLGKRILRTETAGMAVLAWIDYCLEVEA